jgi:multiple sugar transport system substrate-binding protein
MNPVQTRFSRRQMLFALGAGMTGTFLAACAPTAAPAPGAQEAAGDESAPSTEPLELVFWYWADDPYQASLLTDSLARYTEKNPHVTFAADLIQTINDTRTKLVTSFAAGTDMPDFSEGADGWLPEFNRAGMLVPLDDRIQEWEHYEDWLPAVKDLAKDAATGTTFLMVNKVMVNYTYYRADWLEEAGLEPPDTQEDFLEVARALTDAPNRYGYGLRGGDNGGFSQQLAHFLKGNGVDFVKEDGTIDWDSPEAIETTDWYVSLYTEHKVTQPSAPSDRFPELFALLQGGTIALLDHGIWSWKTQSDALGDAVSAMQKVRGSVRRWVSAGAEGPIMYSTSQHQDETWEVLKHMASPEEAFIFSVERGAGPTFQSLEGEAIYSENRFFKAALESAPYWGRLPFEHENWPAMNDRYAPEMQELLAGNITVEQFCQTMASVLRGG